MHRCCVFGCKNVGIHLFPKDKKIRKLWEIAVRVKNFKAANHSRLCTAHFKPEDYQKEGFYTGLQNSRRVLKKGVVPSLFVWNEKESSAAEQRRKRTESRDARKKLVLYVTGRENESSGDKTDKEPTPIPDTNNSIEQIATISKECVAYNPDNLSPSTRDIGTQKNFQFFTIEYFRHNDEGILFYTGLESFDKFMFVFSTLCPEAHSIKYKCSEVLNISAQDQFFLTLIKLKQNKEDYELELFFNISTSLVSNIFITWVNFLYQMWKILDDSPSNSTEIPRQCLQNLGAQQAVRNSCKSLASDKHIVEQSLLLDRSEKEDSSISNCDKIYRFLKAPVDIKYVPLKSKIYFVCQMLSNLKEGILQRNG